MSPRGDLSLQPRSAVPCSFGESSNARRASADPGSAKRSAAAAGPSPPWMRVFKAACMAGCHAQHQQTAFAKKKSHDAMFFVNTARRASADPGSAKRSAAAAVPSPPWMRVFKAACMAFRACRLLTRSPGRKSGDTGSLGHPGTVWHVGWHSNRSPQAPAGGLYGLGNIREGLLMCREPASLGHRSAAHWSSQAGCRSGGDLAGAVSIE
jgi:hypothetical protein